MSDYPTSSVVGAVFLSYAHEDAGVARRMAEALRAVGIDVWFDENELRGGDAWDAKIKKQIRECALFVPVISQHTQARREGYFRLEWHLAEDRTRLIAKGTPFLMPVAVDGTSERDALVPDVFLTVQWTRLQANEPASGFAERVKTLLLGSKNESTRSRPFHRGEITSSAKPRSRMGLWVALAVLAVGAAGTFFVARKSPSFAAKAPLEARSIAILPFTNMSEDKDSGFFAAGVHEDILTSLYLIPDLKVTSRTSVAQYRDTKKTMRQIGQELEVTYLLEGSVRRDGNTVRVTGQLIRAATDEHLWARSYDKEWKDIFAIQSELAQAIAAELQAKLSPQAKKLLDRRPTENPAAHDLFLKAREIRNYRGRLTARAALEKQENLLQSAVTLDPAFALAWADLAWIHGWTYLVNYDHSAARLAKAKTAIDTAMRLGSDSPEVILNLGYYYYFGYRDYVRATAEFQKASRLQPNAPAPRYALALIQKRLGNWSAALEGFRLVARLDPANLDNANQLALAATSVRRWDIARAERQRIYTLAPDATGARNIAMLAFWSSGSTSEMEALLSGMPAGDANTARRNLALMRGDYAECIRLEPVSGPVEDGLITESTRVLPVATAFAAQGDLAGARALLEKLPSKFRARIELESENADAWSRLGMVEAVLGHNAEALRCAQKAVELIPDSVDASEARGRSFDLAFVFAWTGDKDRALAEYARLFRVGMWGAPASSSLPLLNVHTMRRHPFFFPLQGNPRFEALLSDPENNAPLH